MLLDEEKVKKGVELIVEGMGATTASGPFKGTPERIVNLLKEKFDQPLHEELKTFPSNYVNNIKVYKHRTWTLCPHHLLPVLLTINVDYRPREGRVLGTSKVPRLIEKVIATGPALQEDLTVMLANTLGVYSEWCKVEVHGLHLCCLLRGVKSGAEMTTFAQRTSNFFVAKEVSDEKNK